MKVILTIAAILALNVTAPMDSHLRIVPCDDVSEGVSCGDESAE